MKHDQHFNFLESQYESLSEHVERLFRTKTRTKKLHEIAPDPEFDEFSRSSYWSILCTVLLGVNGWIRLCEDYKKYYGFDDLPDKWSQLRKRFDELFVELEKEFGLLELPEKIRQAWRGFLKNEEWLPGVLEELVKYYDTQAARYLTDKVKDDDDIGSDEYGFGPSGGPSDFVVGVAGFSEFESSKDWELPTNQGGDSSSQSNESPSEDARKKMLVQWKRLFGDSEKAQQSFYKSYHNTKVHDKFHRWIWNAYLDVRHSDLRVSWLEERNSFIARAMESSRKEQGTLMNADECKRYLGEYEKKNNRITKKIIKIIKPLSAKKNAGFSKRLQQGLSRMYQAISEIGFDHFIEDIMAENMRGGPGSPVHVQDFSVLSCMDESSEQIKPAEILFAVHFHRSKVDFDHLFEMVRQYIKQISEKTRAVIILTDFCDSKPPAGYDKWKDTLRQEFKVHVCFFGIKDRDKGDVTTLECLDPTPGQLNSNDDSKPKKPRLRGGITLQEYEAPTGVALANTVSSLPEDTDTSSAVKVADIQITDDALSTNAISLSGTDAASFAVVGTELFLAAGTALDYESQASYDVTVSVEDSSVAGSTPVTVNFTLAISDIEDD